MEPGTKDHAESGVRRDRTILSADSNAYLIRAGSLAEKIQVVSESQIPVWRGTNQFTAVGWVLLTRNRSVD